MNAKPVNELQVFIIGERDQETILKLWQSHKARIKLYLDLFISQFCNPHSKENQCKFYGR